MLVRNAKKIKPGYFEWDFGHGFSSYKKNQSEVKQDVETALYEFKYDCFFALQNGIDWITRMGKTNQKQLLDNDIQTLIQNRYGVLGVTEFNSNIIDRTYHFQCNIYTIYSESPYLLEFSQGV